MSNDTITRAKAQAAEWREQQQQAWAETRFSRCTPAELIKIAETQCDLQGRPLRDGDDIIALDDAWFSTFGEQLCAPVGRDGDHEPRHHEPEPVPLDEHPLLSMPDDVMLRPRDVRRIFGYSRSTLKRHMANGKFPRPLTVAPGQRYIGWPARQLKAWLLTAQDAGHNAARH